MNWNQQASGLFNDWLENQRERMEALGKGKGLSFPAGNAAGQVAYMSESVRQMTDLWQKAMASWASLSQPGMSQPNGAGFDLSKLSNLIDPAAWAKAGSGGFDVALERLTEGPVYATLWDLDRKTANAQKLWAQRTKDIAAYQALIQAAWSKAFERFVAELNNPQGTPIQSGRELLEVWITVANETLLETHRSEQFLEAQRRMTRSSTDYRLQEREIAEVFCEMHHLPTRTEMDEVQRMVLELRRELRALKRERNATAPKTASAKPRRRKQAAVA
jgi:hypothetical protein